ITGRIHACGWVSLRAGDCSSARSGPTGRGVHPELRAELSAVFTVPAVGRRTFFGAPRRGHTRKVARAGGFDRDRAHTREEHPGTKRRIEAAPGRGAG